MYEQDSQPSFTKSDFVRKFFFCFPPLSSPMAFRETSDSAQTIGSDRTLDLESGTIHELDKSAPGMWQFPTIPDICCIYRVPYSMRQLDPESYIPQFVIIGPLHHSLKSQALKCLGDITNTKSIGYLNMEEHKKIYLEKFSQRVGGKKAIDGFRRIIEEDEEMIRASYSESTTWIPSQEFVDMILHDSVFILEFILRISEQGTTKRGDPLIDQHTLSITVRNDLLLLENQLPYFILEKLFDPVVPILRPNETFRELVIDDLFGFDTKVGNNSKFRHFTDLNRCVYVETLPEHGKGSFPEMEYVHNADKLDRGGIKFKAVEEDLLLDVRFVNGCLKIPCLYIHADTEKILRNVMALEQCHYPDEVHVSNYFVFLASLIDTDKDVDLFVEKGIIKNWIGQHRLVADVVNRLSLGVTIEDSYYSNIVNKVNAYYSSPVNSSLAILKRVYFGNMWTGTATVAATLLLLMTLIQTVASVIQAMQ
ncbi:hypothetical protein ISN44_As08g039510 [Arabidopsis suecica]|uniref:Uncharacterized protein n=1 Tax=Arabidopsis suecica TaxID=45249 RepID=A0A8T2BBB5_ARASU|nr:hypothetical protein ISN44_As08g039510 [Arabidopsis suecica]